MYDCFCSACPTGPMESLDKHVQGLLAPLVVKSGQTEPPT